MDRKKDTKTCQILTAAERGQYGVVVAIARVASVVNKLLADETAR